MGEDLEVFDWAESKPYEPKQQDVQSEEEAPACEIGCDSCGS